MGHGSIDVTHDVYGHLLPGNEDEAARLTDEYLTAQQERAEDQAATRAAQLCLWDSRNARNGQGEGAYGCLLVPG